MSLEGSLTGCHTLYALTPPPPPTQYSAPPMAAAPSAGGQSAGLKEMVEILDEDPRLLSKVSPHLAARRRHSTSLTLVSGSSPSQYLQQAGNNVDAALSTYLADQSNGTLLRI